MTPPPLCRLLGKLQTTPQDIYCIVTGESLSFLAFANRYLGYLGNYLPSLTPELGVTTN